MPPQYEDIVFSKGTTTTEVAAQNLRKLGLDCFVHLVSGDAFELDHDKCDLIFCDAVHEPHGIEANVSHLLARSNHGCIWALHDMNQINVSTSRTFRQDFRWHTSSVEERHLSSLENATALLDHSGEGVLDCTTNHCGAGDTWFRCSLYIGNGALAED